MRTVVLTAFVVFSGWSGHAQTPPDASPQNRPTFRSASADLVVLPVTVTDQRGGLVADLPLERFTVLDNGRAQDILFFSNDDTPVSVAWVLDNSTSMRGKLAQVRLATLRFAELSHPEDELFLLQFNDRVEESFGGRPITIADSETLQAGLLELRPQGRTALYDALLAALDRVERTTRARKAIVVISDGDDNASRARLDDVLSRARRSNVTIYTVGIFDPYATDANPQVLERLASATGGVRFLPRSAGPLLQACSRIAREIRSAYTVSFVPPERDGRYHEIRVVLGGPDRNRLKVRTRPGYVAPVEQQP